MAQLSRRTVNLLDQLVATSQSTSGEARPGVWPICADLNSSRSRQEDSRAMRRPDLRSRPTGEGIVAGAGLPMSGRVSPARERRILVVA